MTSKCTENYAVSEGISTLTYGLVVLCWFLKFAVKSDQVCGYNT
jgi:hypothetical protein